MPPGRREGYVDVLRQLVLFRFDNNYEAFCRAFKLKRACAATLRGGKVGGNSLSTTMPPRLPVAAPGKSIAPSVATPLGALSMIKVEHGVVKPRSQLILPVH